MCKGENVWENVNYQEEKGASKAERNRIVSDTKKEKRYWS